VKEEPPPIARSCAEWKQQCQRQAARAVARATAGKMPTAADRLDDLECHLQTILEIASCDRSIACDVLIGTASARIKKRALLLDPASLSGAEYSRLLDDCVRQGFDLARYMFRDLLEEHAKKLQQAISLLRQRRENGALLAEEGRAARKPATDQRAERICRLYKRIRPRHPAGRKGNGVALAAVATQFGPLPGHDTPITVKAVRLILKRCGVPCR